MTIKPTPRGIDATIEHYRSERLALQCHASHAKTRLGSAHEHDRQFLRGEDAKAAQQLADLDRQIQRWQAIRAGVEDLLHRVLDQSVVLPDGYAFPIEAGRYYFFRLSLTMARLTLAPLSPLGLDEKTKGLIAQSATASVTEMLDALKGELTQLGYGVRQSPSELLDIWEIAGPQYAFTFAVENPQGDRLKGADCVVYVSLPDEKQAIDLH